jgi:hypothetical protein
MGRCVVVGLIRERGRLLLVEGRRHAAAGTSPELTGAVTHS